MDKTGYRAGELCWADLGTVDVASARRFYGELFAWHFVDEKIDDDGFTYVRAQLGGRDICAIYDMPPDERMAASPHWNVYAAVIDVHAAAARADRLGGVVFAGPFDVSDIGRMAMVRDPSGSTINLWQPRRKFGAERFGEAGALAWFELASRDPSVARHYYEDLFAWRAGGDPDYLEWSLGDAPLAGMIAGELGWSVYFQVVDLPRVLASVIRLGGRVLGEPREVPRVGRFVRVADPSGAIFSLIEPA